MQNTLLDFAECPSHSKFLPINAVHKELKSSLDPDPGNLLSILSMNIRSLRKNFNLLLLLLKSLKQPISIIALCETFLVDGEEELFPIPGYTAYFLNRQNISRSGGLMIYVSETLISTKLEQLSMLNEFFDSLFIKLTIKNQTHTFGLTYRSPSISIPQFTENFDELILKKLSKERVTICGGININLLNRPSSSGIKFVTNMNDANLSSLITVPTRPRINSSNENPNSLNSIEGSLIDHVWSSYEYDMKPFVLDFPISDHFPVCLFIKIPNVNKKIRIKYRTFNHDQIELFRAKFERFCSNFRINSDHPDFSMSEFLSFLTNLINEIFPIKEKIMKLKELNSPWIDNSLLKLIAKKHRIFKNYRRGLATYEDFKQFRNLLNKTLNLAKKIYLSEKINSASNQKDNWKIINNLKSNNVKTKNISLKINNSHVLDTKVLSHNFSDHFDESVKCLITGLSPTIPHCHAPRNANTFDFHPITESEVLTVIDAMNDNNKHHSEIPTILLKLIAPKLSVILTSLFNACLNKSIFPNELKIGQITPIHKKGPKDEINNYRPITILNPIAKILEKIICNRLTEFLVSDSILVPQQYGFMKGRSIQSAVLTFQHDAHVAKKSKKYFGAIAIDLKKAFDTINHNILLHKLQNYGIRKNNEFEFLKSYFHNRYNFVQVGPSRSSLKKLVHGVPQGSSLGPLMFNIFINDIVKIVEHCQIILYADDILLYVSDKYKNKVNEYLNNDLLNIFNYAKLNHLVINYTKTKCLLFNCKNGENLNITINSVAIEQVKEIKYLGIILDDKLSFKSYILEITKKLNQCNRAIAYLKQYLPTFMLFKLYYSFGHSHLSLHILSWAGTFPSYIKPVNIALNKIVRNIHYNTNNPYVNTNQCYNDLNLLTTDQLYKLKLGEFIFRVVKGDSPIPQDFVSELQWSHNHNTRRVEPLRNPHVDSAFETRTFTYNMIKLWNKLKIFKEIESYNSLPCFKKALKIEIKTLS